MLSTRMFKPQNSSNCSVVIQDGIGFLQPLSFTLQARLTFLF